MAFDPISGLLAMGEKLIDKLLPDPKAKAEALIKLKELEQSGDLAVIASQVEINKIEAANPNLFVAGWRPFIGWICGLALMLQFLVLPFTKLQPLNTELLTTLLIGMLGLGGLRTVEKLQGKTK